MNRFPVKPMKSAFNVVPALSLALICGLSHAAAPSYPEHPVRMVNPSAAGGNADLLSRVAAQRLSEVLGQQFVVDNRAGARGVIATDTIAKAAPDGYTLGFISSVHAINAGLVAKLPFDAIKDFAAISQVGSTPFIISVTPALPVKSLKELIALAQAKPGQINYADNGSGSRLAAELLISMTGTRMMPISYKAAAQAFLDLMSGDVQLMYATATSVLPHIKAGKIRALAITGRQRSALAPELMTAAEAGLPGYEADIWTGLVAPARTPPAIINRLNATLSQILKAPEVRERIIGMGADPISSAPAEFQALIASDVAKWSKLIKDAGLHFD